MPPAFLQATPNLTLCSFVSVTCCFTSANAGDPLSHPLPSQSKQRHHMVYKPAVKGNVGRVAYQERGTDERRCTKVGRIASCMEAISRVWGTTSYLR